MEPKSVIELVVGIAMVVIIGFAVIALVQFLLTGDGAISQFLNTVITDVTDKAHSLIDAVTNITPVAPTP